MSEGFYYIVTLLSIFISPVIFRIIGRRFLSYSSWGVVALFFISWYWAIHYKGTPEDSYLGEIAFTIMICISTILVWMSLCLFIKQMFQTSSVYMIIFVIVSGGAALLFAIDFQFPASLDIFYAHFHFFFLNILIVSSISAWGFYRFKKL